MKLSDNRTSWRKAVRNGAARMRLGVIALVAVSGCLSQAASGNPQITSVQFSGSSGNYTLTVNGSGFGTLPSSLPFSGDSHISESRMLRSLDSVSGATQETPSVWPIKRGQTRKSK